MKFWLIILLSLHLYAEQIPQCSNKENWAASMAFVYLKNKHILENNSTDFEKTAISLMASQKVGSDLFRQVHDIIFFRLDGTNVRVITVNDASNDECSMSDVDVYLISEKIH